MPFRKLKYGYHDSSLKRCHFGPGREVTLEIRLDPVWNQGAPQNVNLCFLAIRNFEEVRAFFEEAQKAPNQQALCEVIGVICTGKGSWLVDLARIGSVTIETTKMPREV